MSGEQHESDLSRRTFMKAAGVATGASLLGAGSAAGRSAVTDDELAEFLDYRVQEARKVWNRGYRGRIDRPLGLTDSGVDARHPDVGPWNGVRIDTKGGDPVLVEDPYVDLEASESFAGTVGPGAIGAPDRSAHELAVDGAAVRVEASMHWDPADQGNALVLEENTEEGWEEVARHGGATTHPQLIGQDISSSRDYRVVAETEANVSADYTIDVNYLGAEEDSADDEVTRTAYTELTETTVEGSFGPSGPGHVLGEEYPDELEEQVHERDVHVHPMNGDAARVRAQLTWEPQQQDLDFSLRTSDGEEIASSGNVPGEYESIVARVEGGQEYEFVVDAFLTTDVDYTITVTEEQAEEVVEDVETVGATAEEIDDPSEVTAETDKVVGWHDAGSRYGRPVKPRDEEAAGHGTHVSGIMAGTGRASAINREASEIEQLDRVLAAGSFVEREVDAAAGTGVFAAVYGNAVDVIIEGPDGRELDASRLVGYDSSALDNNIVQAPTVHDAGTATYTVHVRPAEGEVVSVGTVDRIAYGPFLDPDETQADRNGEAPGLRSGLAPDAGIVGFQGLGGGTEALASNAGYYAETFGLRTVNMSWGTIGGLPTGATGDVNFLADPELYRQIAEGGVLTVAAAGNSYTPANGNSTPAVADEAVSVVSTGPLDGIAAYSSGGVGAIDEDDGSTYAKPDVTAPGGRAPIYPASLAVPNYDLIHAAMSGNPAQPGSDQTIRDYYDTLGTSMASPYACGATNLVAEAMDAVHGDAPEAIELPTPEALQAEYDAEERLEHVMRLKQVVLATASETAFTAAPYHTLQSAPKAPTYDFGDRDPYEGYGRINPDAAVDAVTETLFDAVGTDPNDTVGASLSGTVGLDVPRDSRAVARNVVVPDGTLSVDLTFDRLLGTDRGMAQGDPHLDLFVYDAEQPAVNGEPNVVASAQGLEGNASVEFDVETPDGEPANVYYVVAKLVNVPGVVNGFDVQVQFDLDVSFEAAPLPPFTASGFREEDGTVFTSGQTNHVEITVTGMDRVIYDDPELFDVIPWNWEVIRGARGDPQPIGDGQYKKVPLGPVSSTAVGDGKSVTRDYFVEAPDEPGDYEFGPAILELEDPEEHGYRGGKTATATVGGSQTNVVTGVDQNDATDSPTDSATGTVEDGADDAVDTVGDTYHEVT